MTPCPYKCAVDATGDSPVTHGDVVEAVEFEMSRTEVHPAHRNPFLMCNLARSQHCIENYAMLAQCCQ